MGGLALFRVARFPAFAKALRRTGTTTAKLRVNRQEEMAYLAHRKFQEVPILRGLLAFPAQLHRWLSLSRDHIQMLLGDHVLDLVPHDLEPGTS